MLSIFLIIIILIIGIGIIHNNYFNNKSENKGENILNEKKTDSIINTIQYKPFSINENKGTVLDSNEISVKTPYTREKNTTGLFNII